MGDKVRLTAVADSPLPGARRIADWSERAGRHSLRSRMVVAAVAVPALVRAAGGWLFDQAMAGWDVTVVVAESANSRPLRILGTGLVDLESATESGVRGPLPHRIAVDATLYRTDERTRLRLQTVIDDPTIEVLLFGGALPEELHHRFRPVEHRLSTATLAFKAQALNAAATTENIDAPDAIERFHAGPPPVRR